MQKMIGLATTISVSIVLSLSIVLPCNAKSYTWNDYHTPLRKNIRVCHDEKINILFDLPKEFLTNTQNDFVKMLIEIKSNSKPSSDKKYGFKSFNAYLKFNDQVFGKYRVPTKLYPREQKIYVEVKKKHLIVGSNIVTASFGWRNNGWCTVDCCSYVIQSISFEEVVRPTYKIVVSSEPAGASFTLDGKYIGDTPIQVECEQGWHKYVLAKDGYKERKAEIWASKDRLVHLKMNKLGGGEIPLTKTTGGATIATTEKIANTSTEKKPKHHNADAIAVVIGNRNYANKDIPTVEYAKNDAAAVKRYLIGTLGYKTGNVISETDTTNAKLAMIFGTANNHRGMLYNYIKPERSDVFIYYSGHGSPDPQTNQAYLIPTDCNPAMIDLTAYPLGVLYGNLSKIEAKNIIVVLDACF